MSSTQIPICDEGWFSKFINVIGLHQRLGGCEVMGQAHLYGKGLLISKAYQTHWLTPKAGGLSWVEPTSMAKGCRSLKLISLIGLRQRLGAVRLWAKPTSMTNVYFQLGK
ncbi:hypothetical protein VNO80_01190 [Phaseolus coccineus]|uniref:Uncharacterized protein n=1 Tax=Phaseolus coccineus TaxID=3886 RepID=A0AAN9RR20_PHACN